MKRLNGRHPHIVYAHRSQQSHGGDLYLTLELAENDMFDQMQAQPREYFSEGHQFREWMLQCAHGECSTASRSQHLLHFPRTALDLGLRSLRRRRWWPVAPPRSWSQRRYSQTCHFAFVTHTPCSQQLRIATRRALPTVM